MATVETNIVRFKLSNMPSVEFVDRLYEKGLHVLPSGHDGVRALTYLDISREQVDGAVAIIKDVMNEARR